ncbi:MAG: non-homologous end-joining DNA ligase [Frankiaceae bacterium]|nr:non-homologous end-joining DNA ligase [Frankiaceae bacterium]MBV9870072.1 non-homologous end-joining DNA ligase [Frankiaceae bacterium]
MSRDAAKVDVDVEGRTLTLSNLEKVLYPEAGFTKGEVIDYYARIAPVLLPHLAGRPTTFKRYPNGVEGKFFFEKNAPSHAPSWLKSVTLPSPGSTKSRETINYPLISDLPSLVWAANLAALELHVPMWRVGPRGKVHDPDLLVFDLDPGPPATIVECCEVARLLQPLLEKDGLTAYPKTSGSKGLQLYVPVTGASWEQTHSYAREIAQRVADEQPELVVWQMKKDIRGGKILIDWSQNNAAKTTICVYSLRARPHPTVSTPISWREVESCTSPADLVFTAPDVLDRVEREGDLFADVATGANAGRL